MVSIFGTFIFVLFSGQFDAEIIGTKYMKSIIDNWLVFVFSYMSGQYADISQWGSIRLAVGSSMFITYFLFYCAYWYSDLKQKDRPRLYVQMTSIATKMYLFGMACLLSMNFFQAGVFQTVFSYLSMVSILLAVGISIFT
jgi:hypothetical protein